MEIKEVCGFKDSSGKFHDTKESALAANKKRQLEDSAEIVAEARYEIIRPYFEDCDYRYDWEVREALENFLAKLYDNPTMLDEYFKIQKAHDVLSTEINSENKVSKSKIWKFIR